MTQPRVPPQPSSEWDEETRSALAVLRPPTFADSAPPSPPRPSGRRPTSNILGILAWHPDLARSFLPFNNHLFHSTLPARDRELVTVRVCWLRGGEYEWVQHVRMAGRAGLTDAEIDAIALGPDAPVWSASEAAILRAADEIVDDRYITDKTWATLCRHYDRRQLMDLVFTIGNYDLLAMAFNVFGLELDEGMEGFPPDAPHRHSH